MATPSLNYDQDVHRRHHSRQPIRDGITHRLTDASSDSDSDDSALAPSRVRISQHAPEWSNVRVEDHRFPTRSLVHQHGPAPSYSNCLRESHRPLGSDLQIMGHYPTPSVVRVEGKKPRTTHRRTESKYSSDMFDHLLDIQQRRRLWPRKQFDFMIDLVSAHKRAWRYFLSWQSVPLMNFNEISEPVIHRGMTRQFEHLRRIHFESVFFPEKNADPQEQTFAIYGLDELRNQWFVIVCQSIDASAIQSLDPASSATGLFNFTVIASNDERYIFAALKMSLAQGLLGFDPVDVLAESSRIALWGQLGQNLNDITFRFDDQISDDIGEIFTTALPEQAERWYLQPFSNFHKDGELQDALARWHHSRISKGRPRERVSGTEVRPWEYKFLPGGPLMTKLR
jgi:hypothetical protein